MFKLKYVYGSNIQYIKIMCLCREKKTIASNNTKQNQNVKIFLFFFEFGFLFFQKAKCSNFIKKYVIFSLQTSGLRYKIRLR